MRFLQDKIKNIQYFFGKEKSFPKLKNNIIELECEPFINDNNIITNKNKINIINNENKNINGNIYEIRKDYNINNFQINQRHDLNFNDYNLNNNNIFFNFPTK